MEEQSHDGKLEIFSGPSLPRKAGEMKYNPMEDE